MNHPLETLKSEYARLGDLIAKPHPGWGARHLQELLDRSNQTSAAIRLLESLKTA